MKTIIFICKDNACRSQIAQAFAEVYGKGKIQAYSAGSQPSEHISKRAILLMSELGIDMFDKKPKGFDKVPSSFDVAVSMGCNCEYPQISAKEKVAWQIPNLKEKPITFFRQARDEIKNKVEELLKTLSS